MNNVKGYLLVAAATAFVSWLLFSPDGDDQDRETRKVENDTSTEERTATRPVPPLPPSGRSDVTGFAQDTGPGSHYFRERAQTPTPVYRPPEPAYNPLEQFSFRPLTERERKRLDSDRTDYGYYDPNAMAPSPTYPQEPGQREWVQEGSDQGWTGSYSQRPTAQPQWYGREYGYRPSRSASDEPKRWTGPYRDWYRSLESDAPWTDPIAPQWGSRPGDRTPPAERMYPSRTLYPGRKLTAR